MPLQTTGEIKLSQIATEFTDAAPHQMSEFYSAATGIPASGEISMADFYGASSGPSTPAKETFRLAQDRNNDVFAYVAAVAASGKQGATPQRMITSITTDNDVDEPASVGTNAGTSYSGRDAIVTLPKSSTGNGVDFEMTVPWLQGSGNTNSIGLPNIVKNEGNLKSLTSTVFATDTSDSAYGAAVGLNGYMDIVISEFGDANNYSILDDLFEIANYWPTRGSGQQDFYTADWGVLVPNQSVSSPNYNIFGSNIPVSHRFCATVDRTKFMDGVTVDGTNFWWRYVNLSSSSTLTSSFPGLLIPTRITDEVGTCVTGTVYLDSETTNTTTAQALRDDLNGSSASYSTQLSVGNFGTTSKYVWSNFFNDARISGLTNGNVLVHFRIHCFITTSQGADTAVTYSETAQTQVVKDWDNQFWNGPSNPANFSTFEIYQ